MEAAVQAKFSGEIGHDAIAVGGPAEHLYVGDKGRIRVFDGEGHKVGEDSLSSLSATGTVEAIAVDAAGDVFFGEPGGVAGVHELEPGGAVSGNVYDATSTDVRALAVDGAGHLFVGDYSTSPRLLEYEVSSPSAAPAELADSEPGKLLLAEDGIAVNSIGAVYVGNGEGLAMFGSLAAMESTFGAPPKLAPTVGAENAAGAVEVPEVTMHATVNPQFSATTYQFQYGIEPCTTGHCVGVPASPASLGAVVKAPVSVSATVAGLTIGKVYDFRVVAKNAAGESFGPEAQFTVGENTVAGTPGLPDGRHYELVSPADKNGNQVYPNEGLLGAEVEDGSSVAAENGNSLLFEATGAMGTADSSVTGYDVATRTSTGWSTQSAVSPVLAGEAAIWGPEQVIPSDSFSKFLFMAEHAEYSREEPLGLESSVNIFLAEAPGAEPSWLGKPSISNPFPAPGHMYFGTYLIDGASADLSTVYFSTVGTLVPEDESRVKHIGQAKGESNEPWGFYEWHDGVLSPAGVLPNGGVSEWGAVPPHITRGGFGYEGTMPDYYNNQVSEDGTKAFFVSPDPRASSVSNQAVCAELKDCTSEAPGAVRAGDAARWLEADGARVAIAAPRPGRTAGA